MKSHESDNQAEQTAPQAEIVSPQMDSDDSPAKPDRTGPEPGDSDHPGRIPQEIRPTPDDTVDPGSMPQEIEPAPGDSDLPSVSPDEMPQQMR